jgi:flagellar motor switch protein FliN/FliY
MTEENGSTEAETPASETEEQVGLEPEASEVEAPAASQRAAGSNEVNLEALLKVPVSLSIEVGRKQVRLDELLDTTEGSVIELDKLLNEPLDVLVNGALIAHGVIVLAQDRFGIQITDILSPEERARSL